MQTNGIHKSNRGFTLIEIMVVVVIIGVLATLVVVNVSNQTVEARKKKARSDIQTIETGLELYRMDNSDYPRTLAELEPKYIKRLPNDPWKRTYVYEKPGVHGEIDIISLGADGQPGGEEDAADIGNWQLR